MKITIIGDVSREPFVNNLLGPVRAFQKVADVQVIEPRFTAGFIPTGAAKPVAVPESAIKKAAIFAPDMVICLGGGLYVEDKSIFSQCPLFAGLAFSDPFGFEASLAIASTFDLFFTQDPQVIRVYNSLGLTAYACPPAIDPELFFPTNTEKTSDILFYGKWTPHRDEVVRSLSRNYNVTIHNYPHESRWSVPTLPPLNDPESLRLAINRSHLCLEFAIMDDAPAPWTNTSRITNRAQFAAACEVPCLIDMFDGLGEFFEPKMEILTSEADIDFTSLPIIGARARQRVLREQTWDARVQMILALV